MYQKLKSDIITAMKAKESDKLTLLRYLDANVQNVALKLRKEIDNDIVISVLKSELNKVLEEFNNAIKYDKKELSKSKLFEKQIIESYLPKNVSEDDLKEEIKIIIESEKDFGKIMKSLKAKFGSLIDMKLASGIVKEMLK